MSSGTLRDSPTVRTTPFSTYDYDMDTRERTLLKQTVVVGDFDPARASFQTGQYPHECGVMAIYGFHGHQARLRNRRPWLAKSRRMCSNMAAPRRDGTTGLFDLRPPAT